jgi:hypothetical protein
MKKPLPFVLCSAAVALCLSAVSTYADYITPRVPPPTVTISAASYTPMGLATVRTVTSARDGGPGSLRQAIAKATPGDIINFALRCPAVIVLTNTLVISQDLTVLGPGPCWLTVMRSCATNTPDFRVFDVEAGAVTLAGMTIRNGSAYSGTNIHDNVGGGILNRGNLTVSNCVITGNSAPTTDWGTNASPSVSLGFGAGIFSDQYSRLTVLSSTISDNEASCGGGAIWSKYTEQFFAAGCALSGNYAAVEAGALGFQGLVGTLQNCTISGNATPPDGYASAFLLVTWPGETATLTLTACTIARNLGSLYGACILAPLYNPSGLTNNLLSTLIANNEGLNFFLDNRYSGNPVLQSLGNNLDSDGTSGLVNGVNGDLVGTIATPINPQLGPLQDNGGPTRTMALLPGSPALGAGACSDAQGAPLPVDQRGFPRPQVTGCDIGAFENQAPTLICPVAQTVPSCNPQDGTSATLIAKVGDPDGDPLVVIWSVNGVPLQTNTLAATHPPRSQCVSFTASYPKGTNIIGLVVSDGKAPPLGCTTGVTVRDAQPPKILWLKACPDQLWPPNGKLMPVTVIAQAMDWCGPVTSKIVDVSSNEPQDGSAPDWIITGDLRLLLRAERSPHGNGRVYTITVRCTNASGNSSTGTVTVSVPRNGPGWPRSKP